MPHLITLIALLLQLTSPSPARGMRLSESDAYRLTAGSTELMGLGLAEATIRLPFRISKMTRAQRSAAKTLRRTGWLQFSQGGRISLTSKARTDSRFYERTTEIAIIPTATKEIVRTVSYVEINRDLVRITLEWHWTSNEIGATLPKSLQANATRLHTVEGFLQWDGMREWSLSQLRGR